MSKLIAVCSTILLAASLAGCKKDAAGSKDWSTTPLEPYAGTVDGIKFSLQVPQGMKLTEQADIRTEWEAAAGDPFKAPHLSVSRTFTVPTSIDEAVEFVMPGDKDVVAKKEAVDGGFLVVWHTAKKGLVRAQVFRIAGDHALDCRASLADDDGIPNFDGTSAWLEKICTSLTLQ